MQPHPTARLYLDVDKTHKRQDMAQVRRRCFATVLSIHHIILSQHCCTLLRASVLLCCCHVLFFITSTLHVGDKKTCIINPPLRHIICRLSKTGACTANLWPLWLAAMTSSNHHQRTHVVLDADQWISIAPNRSNTMVHAAIIHTMSLTYPCTTGEVHWQGHDKELDGWSDQCSRLGECV